MTTKTPDRTISASKPVELPVHSVQNEEDVARAAGYVLVYSADYKPFTDEQGDQLVGFWQSRPADAWVHVHCAAGDGRTTQALSLFDMLENASTTKLRDIVDRQNDASGIDLLSAKTTLPWRHDGEVARGRLLRGFYEYAKQHPRARERPGRAGRPGIPSRRQASSASVTFGTVAFGLTL